MRTYTFRHVEGHESVVRAKSEAVARDAAMRLRWGPPGAPTSRLQGGAASAPYPYGRVYLGSGLTLVDAGVSH